MTELGLIRHFVSVCRLRSFRAAAEELGVSQSSVTKRVQQLEAQLGLRLFNRTTRTVEPTDAARLLLPEAERALQAGTAFRDHARLLAGGDIGGIRVGAVALAAETVIVSALARLSRTHPGLEVEVVVGGPDVFGDLASGRCDVAVGDEANFAASPHAPALHMRPVHVEPLVLVHRRGHPAGRLRKPAWREAALAVPSRYVDGNQVFQALTGTWQGTQYRLNSLSACLMLTASSDVVTLAPRSVVERQPVGHAPVVIAGLDTALSIRLGLATLARNAPTPAVLAFQSALSASRASA